MSIALCADGIIVGHLNASDKDPVDLGEASLDFELVMGLLGHKQEVFLYQTGVVNNDPNAGASSGQAD